MSQWLSRHVLARRSSRGVALLWIGLATMPWQAVAATPPAIHNQPASQTVFYGDSALFRVDASGSAPLRYQWYRDGATISAGTSDVYEISQVSSNEMETGYSVIVSNDGGSATSSVAVLTVDFGLLGPSYTNRLVSFTNVWRFNECGTNLGMSWVEAAYDDGVEGWLSGSGVFDGMLSGSTPVVRTTVGGEPVRTELVLTNVGTGGRVRTYYFRTHFDAGTGPGGSNGLVASLRATTIVDDGAIIHVNGKTVAALGATNSAYDAWANRTVNDPTSKETLDLPTTNLTGGANMLAVEVHQSDSASPDITFGLAIDAVLYPRVRDHEAPEVAGVFPGAGTTVTTLTSIEVHFTEGVKGVTAESLQVNRSPATNVVEMAPDVFVFSFAEPSTGVVEVAWSPTQRILDLSANSNRFAGGSFVYILDPMVNTKSVLISEFMAGSSHTLCDEDGDWSDWIELHNGASDVVDLGGWYLTDDPLKLRKWRFPSGIVMPAKSYLLVWASGNDRTNPAAPLHTSFKLSKSSGSYLALVFSDGVSVISAFPSYPQQYDDVSYGRDRLDAGLTGYYTNATPGSNNAVTGVGFLSEVQFSRASGTFQQPFGLVLSTQNTNASIRYVLVTNTAVAAMTNVPNSASPLYTGPISIRASTQVRARAFPRQAGYLAGPPSSETYLQLQPGAAAFSSDVPLVLFHNFGGGVPPSTVDQSAVMMVFGTGYGRSSLTNPPDLVTRIGINIRGSSSQGNPQSSYAVETWDEFNEDEKVSVLDFPAESDWVFYAPNLYDKPMIHNAFMHGLSRSLGRYSSRVRLVEVFTSFGSTGVNYVSPSSGNYNGVYVLEEKVKASPGRVDVPRLEPNETNAAALSGGYVLKIDRQDSDEVLLTSGNQALVFVEPGMEDLAANRGRAIQRGYISNYVASFYRVLTGANWTNPVTGYAGWIDVDSWIDHSMLNTLALNADALRLSAYLFKDRGERLEMGPLWDCDRSLGTSAGNEWRAWNPRTWVSSNPLGTASSSQYGTDYFNPSSAFANPWYGRLFKDPAFWQKWIDRYQELRSGPLSTNALFPLIDALANQIGEAQAREVARWRAGLSDLRPRSGTVAVPAGYPDRSYSHVFPGTFQGEIDFLKRWLRDRVEFMDTNFLAKPVLSASAGPVSPPFTLTVTTPNAEPGTVTFYTLDGVDPRLPWGGIEPTARSNSTPFTLVVTNNVRLVARNRNPAHRNLTGTKNPPLSSPWSGPVAATFVTATPPLAITEIMYHPAATGTGTNGNPALEFIELKNVGTNRLNLVGIRLSKGIEFTFSNTNAITNLGPGEYLVLVADPVAFRGRYPAVTNIGGVFTNSLENGGESLQLVGALKEPILDFHYDDTWYPATDGCGFSLVVRNENAPFSTWTNGASWRASRYVGGSPGAADPSPEEIAALVVNEVLTHTDLPQVDAVEIHNPTGNATRLDGWFVTDDPSQPMKFRIPSNTVVAAGGYVVFDGTQFDKGETGFAFSSLGDGVYLFSGDGTSLTGYRHGFEFGAQVNGRTFGRYVTSDRVEHFVTQREPTLGWANAGPSVGPVIVNEILFSPLLQGADSDTRDEFVELRNVSDDVVPLYDPLHATNTWIIRGGVEFVFPAGVALAPGSHVLLVNFDPVFDPVMLAWFCNRHDLATNTPLYGPYAGTLANEGERIALYMPDRPQAPPAPDAGYVPYVLVEEVNYSTVPPWPGGTDGTGLSLQRISALGFGDDPANWQAAVPTAATLNVGAFSVDTDQDGQPDEAELLAGTDAEDAQDLLRFDFIKTDRGYCHLQFTPRPGRVYAIESMAVLDGNGTWSALQGGITGSNAFSCEIPLRGSVSFYRLKVTRAPGGQLPALSSIPPASAGPESAPENPESQHRRRAWPAR